MKTNAIKSASWDQLLDFFVSGKCWNKEAIDAELTLRVAIGHDPAKPAWCPKRVTQRVKDRR